MESSNLLKRTFSKPFLVLFYLMISVLIVFIIISLRAMDFETWVRYFSFIILVQFLIHYLFLRILKVNLFSLIGIFLVLSYLFHFGQILIMGFFPNYEFGRFNYYTFYDFSGMRLASEYGLVAILSVFFGVLISKRAIKFKKEIVDENSTLEKCKKIGWILVFFFFPIQLFLDINKLLISISSGYLATYQTGIAGIWASLGYISFIGFLLLILGYCKQKNKALIVFIFILLYLLVTMFTGHRGHQLTTILLYIYIFHKTVYKIKGKNVFIVMLLAFIGLALLNTLASFRSIEGKSLNDFLEILIGNLKGDSIKDMIVELGGTINTLYLVLQQVPSSVSHAYGGTYIAGILTIIPNIGNLFGEINAYAHFTKSLRGHALGGSYIGELYFNFSYLGIFFAVFIGYFVNTISQKVEDLLNSKLYFHLAYLAPLFMYILWWSRDAFSSMLRPFFWGVIVLFILSSFLSRKK